MVNEAEKLDTETMMEQVRNGGKFPDKFIKNCRIAAMHGDVELQEFLGSIFTAGIGVTRDMEEAKVWFIKAALRGSSRAKTVLRDMFDVTDFDENREKYKMREFTEKRANRVVDQIIRDDTYYDRMTPEELEKRVKAYKAHNDNIEKLFALGSCLRLADIVYLFRDDGKGRTVPLMNMSDGSKAYFVFASEKHIPSEKYKAYERETAPLEDMMKITCSDQVTILRINPDTQDVRLPIETVNEFLYGLKEILGDLDDKLANGVSGSQLDEVIFEHLYERKIDCELTDGTNVIGIVSNYEKTNTFGPTVYVQTESDGIVPVYMNKVKFVRDITISVIAEGLRKGIVFPNED